MALGDSGDGRPRSRLRRVPLSTSRVAARRPCHASSAPPTTITVASGLLVVVQQRPRRGIARWRRHRAAAQAPTSGGPATGSSCRSSALARRAERGSSRSVTTLATGGRYGSVSGGTLSVQLGRGNPASSASFSATAARSASIIRLAGLAAGRRRSLPVSGRSAAPVRREPAPAGPIQPQPAVAADPSVGQVA